MKRYLLLMTILAMSLTLSGCGSANDERQAAVAFYKDLYPISKELHQLVDEWNTWNSRASQAEYELNLLSKSKYYETKLRTLSNKIAVLYAPPGLRELKDGTLSAINKGIESFALSQEYVISRQESYRLKAESAQLEFNKLLSLASDEYDDGLAKYKIKASEIVK